ncbi:hypothetical protein AVDCRST_MAG81-5383 [uncultured Synechococcales cyanobacterium]|uniref:Uncharacterized protein n=1 Tax=uncultured Synechococcales cyanobacterium TaxID=1936017 RepID=A0A6N3IPH8_9CYAN|nr:hypothetical protein AVDCRST_MAG81-5383 [uncultured Synechococcales cyanobacterium]
MDLKDSTDVPRSFGSQKFGSQCLSETLSKSANEPSKL